MRRLAPLLLAGLLLAALPSAQAQWVGPQYNIVLTLTPPSESFTENHTKIVLDGRIDYTGDPLSALNLYGVPVTYSVTKVPAWLSATVSPAHDVIVLTMGQTVTGSRTFQVTLIASPGALDRSVVDTVEVTATVYPTTPSTPPKSAAVSVPVQYLASPQHDHDEGEPCAEHETASFFLRSPRDDALGAPEEGAGDDLTVQTGGAVAPVGTWYAVGGFALVGAGVGLMLRRRFR